MYFPGIMSRFVKPGDNAIGEADEMVTVREIRLADFINNVVATRR